MRVVLGTTGSVAATLTPKLVLALQEGGCEVKIAATEKSLYFWDPNDVDASVYRDRDEWLGHAYEKRDPILHIELRDWADVLLIAPLSANTLAKLAHGYADNLLSCVARAWDTTRPVILAPAMNTYMWNHPCTAEQLQRLKRWLPRLFIVEPVAKQLACGTYGIGAMANIDSVMKAVEEEKGRCAR